MDTFTYTTRILSATLLLSAFPVMGDQKAAPQTSSPKMEALSAENLAARKASLPLIEARIKDREEQVSNIIKDIERLNTRMESRIDKIVKTLESMKDSQNSKVRVAKMKEDTMKGLYRTIENYNKRRAEIKEQLRTGKADVGEKAANKMVQAFDAKIGKRASQLIALSESFTEHVDYKKYENDHSNDDYGYGGANWGWDNSRVSEEWKQNRRETVFTRDQHKKMIKALKSSIDDLNQRNNTLRNKSKEGGISAETKKFYQEDIARNEKAITTRSNQLAELMKPGSGSKATTSVSRNEAHDAELMIREIVSDIKRDGNAMRRNYNEMKQQLVSLNKMKKNLEARKEWLKKYEATHGK